MEKINPVWGRAFNRDAEPMGHDYVRPEFQLHAPLAPPSAPAPEDESPAATIAWRRRNERLAAQN